MFRNILQSVFTKGFVALINFFLLIISARYLGAGSRGEINLLVVTVAIIQILNEVYTGYSLTYFIPKFDLKQIFVNGIVFTLLACTLGNTLFYLIGKLLPGYEWMSYLISLLVILNTFNCVIILGSERIALYNLLSFLQPALLLAGLCISIFGLKNYTIESYLLPMLLSFVVAFTVSSFYAMKLVTTRSMGRGFSFKPILTYGLICQLAGLMYILSSKYSYFLLPSREQVGIYGTASSLMESVLIIANGISPVLLARVVNSGDTEKNARLTLALSVGSLVLSLLAVLVLALLPAGLFALLLGKEFSGVLELKELMLYYAPGIIIMSFILIICNYFSAVGKLKYVLYCNSFGLAATLCLAPFLIRELGIRGAAVTADISFAVTAIGVCIFFFKTNKISKRDFWSLRSSWGELKHLIMNRSHS